MILNIVGDALGSSIEFNPEKPRIEDISLLKLTKAGNLTDDSIMTLATWHWWLDFQAKKAEIKDYINYLRDAFSQTPTIGYGPMFFRLMNDGVLPSPPSCGNGAAMRIAPLAVSSEYSMEKILDIVEQITLQTHQHPEGVKGAQAVVYTCKRLLEDKEVSVNQVKSEVEERFGYDLDLDYAELCSRSFDATCQGSVPQALWCALSSKTVEETFKKALTIGGDSDTIACIAGGIAQSMDIDRGYGLNNELHEVQELVIGKAERFLPGKLHQLFASLMQNKGFNRF